MPTGRPPGPGRVPAVVAGVVVVRLALAAGEATARWALLLDVAAALGMAAAARSLCRIPRDLRSRIAWETLAAFPLVWAVAPVVWLVGGPAVLADVARAVAALLVGTSWWCAARAGGTLSRVRSLVDGGIGAAAVVVLAWHGPLAAAWEAAGRGEAGAAAVVVPAATAGVAVFGIAVTVTEMLPGHRVRPSFFVAALLLIAASDVAWTLGAPPLWAPAWVGYALAVLMQLDLTPRVRRRPTRGRQVWLPYVFVAPAATLIAVQAYDGSVRPPQVGAGLAIVALLLVRQHVTLLENDQLVARLEETEQRLRHLATHDSLTGLPGRAALHEHLTALAAQGPEGPRPIALAFVDMDWFKSVNDRWGHATGDAVLVEIARRLSGSVPEACPVSYAARLGGDEFALVLVGDEVADAERLTAVLTDAIEGPVTLGDAEVPVGVSVGVAVVHDGPFSPSALLHEADLAMYAVKRARGEQPPLPAVR